MPPSVKCLSFKIEDLRSVLNPQKKMWCDGTYNPRAEEVDIGSLGLASQSF